MRIAILGRTKMLYDTALKLEAYGHKIVVIGTCKEAPEYTVTTEDFRMLSERLDSDFFVSNTLNSKEIIEILQSANIDIGVSVNWLTVVGKEAIESCGQGILNAHCGDLPRYRGNACANWALINGEEKVGLSIHFMEPNELDSGDIVIKSFMEIYEETIIGEIYNWLDMQVPDMFLEAVNGLEAGSIIPVQQDKDPQKSLRCYPRKPNDSRINWNNNAVIIDRIIRASSEPFAGAYTFLKGQKIIVWRSKVGKLPCPSCFIPGQILWQNLETGEIAVGSGGNSVLIIIRAQVEGEMEKDPCEIVHSLRSRFE